MDFGNVGKEDYLRAEQIFYRELYNKNEEIRRYKSSLLEHEQAAEILKQLPEKTRHNVMVPIGPLAFMPGQLIHTNEVTVLLGESYFIERSASQAIGILSRRKDLISGLISNAEAQSKKLSARASATDHARDILSQHLQDEPESQDFHEPSEEDVEEEESEDDGQGFEFWTNAGFVGGWSEHLDSKEMATDKKAQVKKNRQSSGGPVFEIVEPVGGGVGRVIQHTDQHTFEGL